MDFTRNKAVFDLWKNFAEELKEYLVVPMSTRNACRESFPSSSSSLSPGVAVCIFLLLVVNNWILICMLYYRFMLDTKSQDLHLHNSTQETWEGLAKRSHKQVAMECMKN